MTAAPPNFKAALDLPGVIFLGHLEPYTARWQGPFFRSVGLELPIAMQSPWPLLAPCHGYAFWGAPRAFPKYR